MVVVVVAVYNGDMEDTLGMIMLEPSSVQLPSVQQGVQSGPSIRK